MFIHDVKKYLFNINLPNKKCCAISFLYGLSIFKHTDNKTLDEFIIKISRAVPDADFIYQADTINEGFFKCGECAKLFIRGAFISCGTMTDPNVSYHLELIIPDRELFLQLYEFLNKHDLCPKKSKRKNYNILYYKESANIEDFLTYIGAQKVSLQIMNIKILKDIRNNANRLANCDTANIDKTVNAAQMQIDAIKNLITGGKINKLSGELKHTAFLRLENENASLSELASMHTPVITKSGVNHRLSKIVEISKNGEYNEHDE